MAIRCLRSRSFVDRCRAEGNDLVAQKCAIYDEGCNKRMFDYRPCLDGTPLLERGLCPATELQFFASCAFF